MDDCIRYQEKLHEWVDQELDLPISEDIDLHVSRCPHCADTAKGIRHMKELVKCKAFRPEVPQRLRGNIEQMINLESRRKIVSRWSGRSILPLASTAALILVFVFPILSDNFSKPSSLDASVISDYVFNSHVRSLNGDDKPSALFECPIQAGQFISGVFDRQVKLPVLDTFSIWGVSMETIDGSEIPKVFYRGEEQHISLFLVCMPHVPSKGIHPLKQGSNFGIYCFPGSDFCCLLATSEQPAQYHNVISSCHCEVENCTSQCECHSK